jgi:hypothetical protein
MYAWPGIIIFRRGQFMIEIELFTLRISVTFRYPEFPFCLRNGSRRTPILPARDVRSEA